MLEVITTGKFGNTILVQVAIDDLAIRENMAMSENEEINLENIPKEAILEVLKCELHK